VQGHAVSAGDEDEDVASLDAQCLVLGAWCWILDASVLVIKPSTLMQGLGITGRALKVRSSARMRASVLYLHSYEHVMGGTPRGYCTRIVGRS
jgi:hypothetical protein